MAVITEPTVGDQDDSSFESAQLYSELEETPNSQDLAAAAEQIVALIKRTREYLNQKDREKLGVVNDPTRLAEVNQELRSEFLDPKTEVDPLVKEVAQIFQGAALDHAADTRLDQLEKMEQTDDVVKKQQVLKLGSAKYLQSLRKTLYKYPDMSRSQLESMLATGAGNTEYAKNRIAGLAAEIATYEALTTMPEIASIRFGEPEEDVMGRDLVITLHKGSREIYIDVKSSEPDDARPPVEGVPSDVKNGNIRVWLPKTMIKGLEWDDPQGVQEFYSEKVFTQA